MKTLKKMALTFSLLLSLNSLSGCAGTEHVIQKPGTIGYLGEDLDTKVFLPDDKGKLILGKTHLFKGMKIVTPQTKDEKISNENAPLPVLTIPNLNAP